MSQPSPLRLVALFLAGLAALSLTACGDREDPAEVAEFTPATFEELPGWPDGNQQKALAAFAKSCHRIDGLENLSGLCKQARQLSRTSPAAPTARAFFEASFTPHWVNAGEEGLFTGYYAPIFDGSLERSSQYPHPLYGLPAGLVTIDLAAFGETLDDPERFQGQLTGRLQGRRVIPFEDRAEIAATGLSDAQPIAWLESAVDKFVLQIQGSGQVLMSDGRRIGVGYAGKNGHSYHAIGRTLVERGALTLEEVTMPAIVDWLAANPEAAQDIMNTNPSYVFFRLTDQLEPLGTLAVPLTPERSLAVDRRFIPLGLPLWVDSQAPGQGDETQAQKRLRKLMIAQDTGGAIKGPVRGDVYWGIGKDAGRLAGVMKSTGRYFILLPKQDLALAYGPESQ